jgi:hypothetical protein
VKYRTGRPPCNICPTSWAEEEDGERPRWDLALVSFEVRDEEDPEWIIPSPLLRIKRD